MVEKALKAITELDRVGALAFITCESGPETKPQVVAKFRHIQDAQEYHRALVECGTVARLIELDCGAVAKNIHDNPGTDAHGSVGFCAIELPKLARLSLDCTKLEQLVGLMELVLTTREGINKESAFQFMPWTLEIEEGYKVAIDRADKYGLQVFYRWKHGYWFAHKPSMDDAIAKLTAMREELEAMPDDQFVSEEEAAKQLGVSVDDLQKD